MTSRQLLLGIAAVGLTFLLCPSAHGGAARLVSSNPLASEWELDYSKQEPPAPIFISGCRNGVFSGKVLLVSNESIKGASAKVSDLARSGGGGTIPASAALVRYGVCEADVERYRAFDALVEEPPAEVPVLKAADFGRLWMSGSGAMGSAVLPVWITVRVPDSAASGDYEGRLTIASANAGSCEVPVRLRVSALRLPDPKEWRTFAELVQSPESVALEYNVPLWSDRHFELMEKSFELMGGLGCKTLYVPLICETNFGNSESMVRWVKKGSGYSYALAPAEKYLDLALKHMKPAVVCLYVWDAFLEGGLAKGSHGEEVLGCESKETQEERRALEGKGPPVTAVDPATGKAETALLAQYGDAAAAGPLWKPLLQQTVELATKRGVEKQLAFGVVTDVEPAPQVAAFFKGLQPGIPWLRRGHMRIKDVGGQPLICQIGPSYNTWGYDAKPGERLYGWNGHEWAYPGLSVHFPRSFRDYYSRCRFRMVGECNIMGAQRGFGGLGADFWTVLKNKRGVRAATLAARYPKSSWRNLNIETSMLAPGKAGAIATARYEMMREGLQECEARVIVEKAVIEKKISGELAARAQAVLDERLAAMVDGMGKGWCYDGHWETQKSEFPKFVDGGWQERSGKLFDAAAEVAKLVDPESQKARPSPSAGAAPGRRPSALGR